MKSKTIYTLDEHKLDSLMDLMIQCGKVSIEKQKDIIRNYKTDGSILTEVDLKISTKILNFLKKNFPNCNIISEEEKTPFNQENPYTFVLDPIDGTDVYSNGLPTYAIALGILNHKREPVGAMIVAPRFGFCENKIELRMDPGKEVFLNGKPFSFYDKKEIKIKQITISSKSQKTIDFRNYKGKVRTFGSSIIHLLSPVIFPYIDGCINQRAYAWDLCASHAILKKAGFKVFYPDGSPLKYTDDILINRNVCEDTIYCTLEHNEEEILSTLPLK